MKLISRLVSGLLACATLLAAPAASAQKWIMNGVSEAASGLEGGGGRAGSMGRAQTRMRIGADLAVDESPEDVFGGAVLIAVEPRTAFGLDLRYTRIVRERLALSGGGFAYLQPGSLVGPVAAIEYRHPLSKTFVLTAGPELDVFVFGTDLPDRTVLWQALFHVGMRVSF
ncbi:MAG TPA: hypothetical protein VM925_38075 [Labilithrix sp.]|nr:hypothetical protein [Labilithrix sp.]